MRFHELRSMSTQKENGAWSTWSVEVAAANNIDESVRKMVKNRSRGWARKSTTWGYEHRGVQSHLNFQVFSVAKFELILTAVISCSAPRTLIWEREDFNLGATTQRLKNWMQNFSGIRRWGSSTDVWECNTSFAAVKVAVPYRLLPKGH